MLGERGSREIECVTYDTSIGAIASPLWRAIAAFADSGAGPGFEEVGLGGWRCDAGGCEGQEGDHCGGESHRGGGDAMRGRIG